MRIGINAFPLAVERGGARHALRGLLQALLHADPPLQYIVFSTKAGLEALDGIADPAGCLTRIGIRGEQQILAHRRLFDLYFAPLNYMVPRLNDRPTVAILHDIQEQYLPQFFGEAELRRRREEYPEITRCATRLVTVSEFCKQTICQRFAIDPGKVAVVHNAPQAGLVEDRGEEPMPVFDPPLPSRYLFCPANFHPHKNHRLLLEALGRLRESGESCLSAVFTGVEFPGGFPLRDEIRRLGVGGICRVYRDAPVAQMRYLYRHATAVVLPTLFEGFGMPAIEAMACGCPVVCSDLPALREVADNAALYFAPDDIGQLCGQLQAVMHEPDLRDALVERGRRLAARFTWARSAQRMLGVFDEAAARFSSVSELPAARIGVIIRTTGSAGAVEHTRQSLAAAGYPNLVVVEQPLADDSFRSLWRFAEQEGLDLVGEVVAGATVLPGALHALSAAWRRSPEKAVYLGEVIEHRQRGPRVAWLRRTSDELWKLEGLLHPEMLWLNVQVMSGWDEGRDLAARGAEYWRWNLLRKARRGERLHVLRRALAECDLSAAGFRQVYRAWAAGVFAWYRCEDDQLASVPLARRVEPLARWFSRWLPLGWQQMGNRVWGWLAARSSR